MCLSVQSFKGVSRKIEGCYEKPLSKKHSKGASREFHRCFKGVYRKDQVCFKEISKKCFNNVSRTRLSSIESQPKKVAVVVLKAEKDEEPTI